MKRIYSIVIISVICSLTFGQQIAEILEYTPAPGQWINTTTGIPEAAESLTREGGGLVSLGGYGGYIILKLSASIENDPGNPYGVDFTIFGNALSHWSEPGIVAVMKDENGNGIPDETWYELAGSDHFFPSTIRNYEISYTNPFSEEAKDIQWGDNQGVTGRLLKNNFQHQPYYPDPAVFLTIGESKCTFDGSRIDPVLDFSNPAKSVSYGRRFGYADNNVRIDPTNPLPDNPYVEETDNSGGDGLDISWAVNKFGEYVELDKIDFVKIYTAVNANGGFLGELSTEISHLVDVAPADGYPIAEKIITVKEFPSKITPDDYALEYAVFIHGRYAENETATWTADCIDCLIESNEVLLVGEVEETISLTITLDSDPSITTTFVSQVERGLEVSGFIDSQLHVYPNPARDYLVIETKHSGEFQLSSAHGLIMISGELDQSDKRIDVSGLDTGIYILRYQNTLGHTTKKILIQPSW